ncbi:MAG: hypothetical protein ACO1RX_17055 [Candidatus Sericytochromatia bacterium]
MAIDDAPSNSSPLSAAEYAQLRADLSLELRAELRQSGRQHFFAMGLHALVLVLLAVLLFISARRYHDIMLWGVGFCLMLFSLLEFLDLEYLYSGQTWLEWFKKNPSRLPKKR